MRNSVSKVVLSAVALMLLLAGGVELHAKSLDELIAESKAEKQQQVEAAKAEAKRKAEEDAHQQAAEQKREKELAEKRKAEEEEAAVKRKADAAAAKAQKVAEAKEAKERKLQEAAQKKAEAERQRQAEIAAKKAAEQQRVAADTDGWNVARRANTQAAYTTYLKNFADGVYVLEAKKRLNTLQKPVAVSRPAVAPVSQSNAIEPQMVAIPAGTFTMGCVKSRDLIHGMNKCNAGEQPSRIVRVKAFQMGKYEVTFNEWDRCVQSGVCSHADDNGWGRGERPVIRVNWNDVQVYIKWLSQQTGVQYRLPSEAEWEYAARGGLSSPFPLKDDDISCDSARYGFHSKLCSGEGTVPVGSYAENGYGLHDMAGNVWEWISDCLHSNYQEAPQVGSVWQGGNCQFNILRSGSWNVDPGSLRSANRFGAMSNSPGGIDTGFRLVKSEKE